MDLYHNTTQHNTESQPRRLRLENFISFLRKSVSLTVREGHRLRMFENRVLRRTFELMRERVILGWRSLYNDKIQNLPSSLYIIRVIKLRGMRWATHTARMEERKTAYKTGKLTEVMGG
jgi:hypothetical protein